VRILLASVFFLATISVLAFTQQQSLPPAQQPASSANHGYTLTLYVEGVNTKGGNIGVLVFNSTKGWPEDRFAALRDIVVPAHPGTVKVTIADLSAGDYAIAVAHDVNMNHKLDKNWLGVPEEQWAMSNNPRATIVPPAFSKARFSVKGDMELHVIMQ